MPIPEERLRRSDRMNVWFAVSSIAMTGPLLCMIYIDYARPWREIQDEFFVNKAAFAHLDYLDATRQEKLNEIAEAEARLADARQLSESLAGRRAVLKTELDHADLEFKKANAPWSLATQVLEVTKDDYEKALGAHGPDHPETRRTHDKFQSEEDEVERLRLEKEKWEDKRRELEAQLRDLDKPVREAQKRVDDLKLTAETAKQKDQQFRGVLTDEGLLAGLPIVSKFINAPLGDFVAPKNTPSRHQVNQYVLPEVRQRLNYLESYTTDRCTTCHVAIDDPDFSPDRLARKLERSIPGVSEAMQRLGNGPIDYPAPPTLEGASQPLPAGQVTEHWDRLTKSQRQDYFNALMATVNSYLTASGRKTIQLDQPLLAHPHLDLYLTPESAHPVAKMGCTVCHEGNPQETDFVQAAHSPPTHEVEKEWKDKYYITLLGVPNVTFETITHYWDRPMRLPEHTEAGCAKCHSEINDISLFRSERHGSAINSGQQLFREVGCINCHSVESLAGSRRVGPDLRNVSHKLTPQFVQQWAFFPQKFRPSTRMPHFFLQENNAAGSENQFDPDPELRTKTEVAAISKYLFAVSNKDWKPLQKPEDVTGDADRGRDLFKSVGCLACHSNLAEFGEEWITKDLVHREKLSPEIATHRYKGMTHEQRELYALENFAEHNDTYTNPHSVRFDPEQEYHKPVFSRFAPELSGVGSKVSFEWLYSWLVEPQHYSAETKMPSLRLNPQEAADIATYLLTLKNDDFEQVEFPMDKAASDMADALIFQLLAAQRSERRSHAVMKDDGGELSDMIIAGLKGSDVFGPDEPARLENARKLVSAMSIEDRKMTFLGSKMIGHYGCYACHSIAGFETTTPPGTDLTTWAEKPISQLDFAFYDHAFHDMRHEKEDVFGYVYPSENKLLNLHSPIPDDREEEITHTHHAFAVHKMLNPRIWDREKIKRPYDKLKMPNFYLNEVESAALTTYLLSRVPPRVSQSLKVDYDDVTGPIAKGRALTRELNCVSCHQIEDNAPLVQQYFRRDIGGRLTFDVINAPPLLWGEGAKVQHHWLHSFLQNVITLRPWLQVRMPSFELTNEQATTLVQYFAALSQEDSRQIDRMLKPVEEYFGTVRKSITGSERATPAWMFHADLANVPKSPNETEVEVEKKASEWYKISNLERWAADLRAWGLSRLLVRETDVDALNTPEPRLANAHLGLLDKARFLRELYDVHYPFAEPPVPLHSPGHFERGQNFLVDMGCLKCHVLGPMAPGPAKTTDDFVQVYRLDSVRGEGSNAVAVLNGTSYPVGAEIDGHKLVSATNTFHESGDIETKAIVEGPAASGETERVLLVAPSAPNLGLASQRLQREWLYYWMLNPQWIQPGTKMPMNFPLSVHKVPTSPFEGDEKYPGTGREHIQLLIDYLNDAGMTNVRVPLPKLTAPAEGEDFEEGGSEEFIEE